MKKINQNILFASLFLIVFIIINSGCSDSTKPIKHLTLSIDNPEDSIYTNETVNFKVKIQDATQLYAFHLEIGYDSTKFDIPQDHITIGSFWFQHNYLWDYYQYDEKFSVALFLFEESGISGDGTLFEFQMKGIEQGITEIEILNNSSLYLIDKNGELIEEFDNLTIKNTNLLIK